MKKTMLYRSDYIKVPSTVQKYGKKEKKNVCNNKNQSQQKDNSILSADLSCTQRQKKHISRHNKSVE